MGDAVSQTKRGGQENNRGNGEPALTSAENVILTVVAAEQISSSYKQAQFAKP